MAARAVWRKRKLDSNATRSTISLGPKLWLLGRVNGASNRTGGRVDRGKWTVTKKENAEACAPAFLDDQAGVLEHEAKTDAGTGRVVFCCGPGVTAFAEHAE